MSVERIAIGRVVKSVGLKGEVKLEPLSDLPRRFENLKSVWIGQSAASAMKIYVESVRTVQGFPYLKLDGVSSKEDADALREQMVFANRESADTPEPGSYFIHDIVGMSVATTDGEPVGKVTDVLILPANDVWVVQREKREVLVPAVKEFIKEVDVARKQVTIQWMEGLIDDEDEDED
jgi:16S rRNA processing protein RimM